MELVWSVSRRSPICPKPTFSIAFSLSLAFLLLLVQDALLVSGQAYTPQALPMTSASCPAGSAYYVYGDNNYTDVKSISQANNNAFVLNKAGATNKQSAVYVDAATGNDGADGSALSPLKTITAGVNRIVEGGTVHVAAGTYNENIVVEI